MLVQPGLVSSPGNDADQPSIDGMFRLTKPVVHA
jgi:hypothetical protein